MLQCSNVESTVLPSCKVSLAGSTISQAINIILCTLSTKNTINVCNTASKPLIVLQIRCQRSGIKSFHSLVGRLIPKFIDLLPVDIKLPQILEFFAVSTELHILQYIKAYIHSLYYTSSSHHDGRSNIFSCHSTVFPKPHSTFYCMLFVKGKMWSQS
jgi:hypothetical protein